MLTTKVPSNKFILFSVALAKLSNTLLQVNDVVLCGAAAESCAIFPGDQLVSVDGVRLQVRSAQRIRTNPSRGPPFITSASSSYKDHG